MKTLQTLGAVVAMVVAGSAGAASFCGDLKNGYGPLDYRERPANPALYEIVEDAHFTKDVEDGLKGSSGYLGGDLDYTLRAIPNHYRALATMARLSRGGKVTTVPGAKYPVECYFERATRFAPGDGTARSAYGSYLYSIGQTERAMKMFRMAVDLEPENPGANYNLALSYFEKRDYDNAAKYGKKAYELGFPLPGLKNKLRGVGKWDDAAP